jgi:hypothetical protein
MVRGWHERTWRWDFNTLADCLARGVIGMIEYDKLKQIESLFMQLFGLDADCNLHIKSEADINGKKITYYELNGDIYFCIDDLITKLRELIDLRNC